MKNVLPSGTRNKPKSFDEGLFIGYCCQLGGIIMVIGLLFITLFIL